MGIARAGLAAAAFTLAAAVPVTSAWPGEGQGPSVPVTVPGTDQVTAIIGRSDGGFPFSLDAASERALCLLDRKVIGVRDLRRILSTARTDKARAFRDTLRAVERCMGSKGWTTTFCGSEGEVPCPPPREGRGAVDGVEGEGE